MPTRDEILQQLNGLLQQTYYFQDSEVFRAWQHEASTLLLFVDQMTGNDFRQRFDQISYDPPSLPDPTIDIRGCVDEYDIARKRAEAAHEKGERQAHGVLNSALKCMANFQDSPTYQNVSPAIIPKDIEQLPTRLLQLIPDVHDVILAYLSEAITCLKVNACLAATIMIGCASEKAIFLLMDTFIDNIDKPENKEAFLKKFKKSRDISYKYDVFEASFKSYKPKPTDDRIHGVGFDMAVRNMFHSCRIERNEVGHPKTIPDLNVDVVLISLRHFPTYLQCIYALIEHFNTHKVTL